MPRTKGSSGPTTKRSMAFSRQNTLMPSKSFTDRFTLMPCCKVPALPGAMNSLFKRLLCANFQANACSRPPEPNIRIFVFFIADAKIGRRSRATMQCGSQRRVLYRPETSTLLSRRRVAWLRLGPEIPKPWEGTLTSTLSHRNNLSIVIGHS